MQAGRLAENFGPIVFLLAEISRKAGDHDGGHARPDLPHSLQQFLPIHPGHAKVGDERIDRLAFMQIECRLAIISHRHFISEMFEVLLARIGKYRLVVDN